PRRGWQPVAPAAPQRLAGKVLDRQPAWAALPRPHGGGALLARPEEAQGALHAGDTDHPRGEAIPRAVPGDHRLRDQPAHELHRPPGLPPHRVRDDGEPPVTARVTSSFLPGDERLRSLVLVHGAGSGPWVFDGWPSHFPGIQTVAVDLQDGLAVEHA